VTLRLHLWLATSQAIALVVSPRLGLRHLGKFSKKWFGPYKIQYVLPNNIMLLVTIEKFETNHVLVNVNKFKPYKYMEFEV